MSTDQDNEDDEIQKELRAQQKFSMSGAIGRSAGGAMKGASPIPERDQVVNALVRFSNDSVRDASGALKSLIKRRIKTNLPTIDAHLDDPLTALEEILRPIVEKEAVLHEFVRQVDVKWGQLMMERPHFQKPGQTPHPDDEYTHSSVKKAVTDLLKKITDEKQR
ncbi:MAG: hypothetical protein HQL50_01575 [Magnetococcales bacterium]|nr:hypothetical protein [Magnetococcales bacterium]